MARRVFSGFHYGRGIWRANVVRKSWATQDRQAAGFFDASLWEDAKKKDEAAIKRMIDEALEGTSVTAVLVGAETATRRYVRYEIDQSLARGNGLLGVYINQIEDAEHKTDSRGENPVPAGHQTFGWFADDGYQNLGKWVEAAAKAAGR